MKQYIKSSFYAGFIALLPLVLTLYITSLITGSAIDFIKDSLFIKFMVDYVFNLESVSTRQEAELYIKPIIYLLTLIGIALWITLIGAGLKFVIGKKIIQFLSYLFNKIPIVKSIYTTINQITHLLSSGKSNAYKKVVLVEYPRDGIFSLGFLTSDSSEDSNYLSKDVELVNVFIPTSPNPTSGMFLMIPKGEVRLLEMKVEDAVKLIVSGGAVIPTDIKNS